MGRIVGTIGCLCLLAGVASGQTVVPQFLRLKWVDCEVLAARFGGAQAPSSDELYDLRQRWVDHFAQTLARELPRDLQDVRPRWRYGSTITTVPREQVAMDEAGNLERFLPPGLDGPPIPVREQNALLVRGTPAAIDHLRELIQLLDVKPRMVNVDVRMVDAPSSQTDEWGIDFGKRIGDLIVGSRGNMPLAGPQARYRRDGLEAGIGWDRRRSSGNSLTAANITTTNNVPAVITTGRTLPYVTSRVTYDARGNRYVDTVVDAIFIGTELFVQPRINNDDTVTMLIRPTFIEASGTIIGPNGVVLPITQTVGAETRVTVRDGETIQLGGFERSLGEYSTRFEGALRAARTGMDSHPNLFVTPRIIRELGGQDR